MSKKPTIKLRAAVEESAAVDNDVDTISKELTEKLQALSKVPSKSPPTPDFDYDSLACFESDTLYKPTKKQISIRMDADLLQWFQQQPGKYQQLINKACRVYMRLKQQ